jgi:hypothetical protein
VPQHPAIAERHHAIALFEERDRLGPCSRRLLLQELRRQASWHPDLVDFFHYQDRNDFEVDIVLERSVAAGRQFAAGVVPVDGVSGVRFEDDLSRSPGGFCGRTDPAEASVLPDTYTLAGQTRGC